MIVKYSSNNSGGSWWLKDKDWKALERAGWKVKWFKDQENRWLDADGERFLGALADEATKEFDSAEDAIYEWEKITGQWSEDKGCECCGSPHNFS